MLNSYKIALVQMYSELGEVEKNVAKAEGYIRQAARQGAKLIMLPEMFHSGINFNCMREDLEFAEKIDGPTLSRMTSLAKELEVYLLCPIVVLLGENIWENRAFFIDNQGQILGSYAKTHPVGDERVLLQRGTQYPVFDTELGKIGISICYDVCFPEMVRLLGVQGAQVLLVTAGWRGSHYYKEWWDSCLRCRAIDNLMYVAAVNACGSTGDGTELYAGKSQVINPVGTLLQMAGTEEETILYQTIYPKRVIEERKNNSLLYDRHPEDYDDILSSIVVP